MTTEAVTTETVWRNTTQDPGAFVWVLLALYMVGLLGVAGWSLYRRFAMAADATTSELMADHYLGNREFKGAVLALTTFATVFSGYTVVGVPGETYFYGFQAIRWLFCVAPMGPIIAMIGSRLQILSCRRGYISPTDFVKDRHNSHFLRGFVSLCLSFPAIVYVLAQFVSMGGTIEGLSNGEISSMTAAAMLCVVMLLYESFGGLRAIVWTDAVQGGILITGFLIFYGVQEEEFGGAEAAGNYMRSVGFSNMLTNDQIAAWFGFQLPFVFGYAFYPQMIQRYQAAKTQWDWKISASCLLIGTWLAMTSSYLTGMCAMYYFGTGHPNIANATQVYGATMRATMNFSDFGNFLGSVMITMSVAAFMSTADSSLNAFSACLTLDLIKPYPNFWKAPLAFMGLSDVQLGNFSWTGFQLEMIGKVTSVVGAIIALVYSDTDIELGALITLQNGVLMQVFPAYFFGMLDYKRFFTATAYSVGIVVGAMVYVLIQCVGVEECVQPGVGWFAPISDLHPSVFALFLNIMCVVLISVIEMLAQIDLQPLFDKIDQAHKFPTELLGTNLEMTGIKPWDFPYNIWTSILVFLYYFAIPWWRNRDDWGQPEEFSGGIPRYVSDGFIVVGILTILMLGTFFLMWDSTPEDNEDLSKYEMDQIHEAGLGTETEAEMTGKRMPHTTAGGTDNFMDAL